MAWVEGGSQCSQTRRSFAVSSWLLLYDGAFRIFFGPNMRVEERSIVPATLAVSAWAFFDFDVDGVLVHASIPLPAFTSGGPVATIRFSGQANQSLTPLDVDAGWGNASFFCRNADAGP